MLKYTWLLAATVFANLAQAFPASMDIGTFTIDNYAGNGGGLPNLSYQIAMGQGFFAGANANIASYSNSAAAPGSGTSAPTFNFDYRNTQVTKTALTYTGTSSGDREYCDFVYYGGHGLNGSLYLGAGAGYGGVFPADMHLGLGYNRWFMAHGCSVFKTASAPAVAWKSGFKGLKALLSFKSVIFDNNLGGSLFNEFWLNWTYREKSLKTAFFDAEASYGYKHLYPTKGLEPGCLSAQVAAGATDYCSESFRNVKHDYVEATSNTGYFYSRVIGKPQY